jgi:hypothetical protein
VSYATFSRWQGKERLQGRQRRCIYRSLVGAGYALCLDRLVKTANDSALCFKALEPRMEVGLDIVWKKHQMLSKPAGKFLAQMQKCLAESL